MSTSDDPPASAAAGETRLSIAVVEAVSAALETPALDLPPLGDTIDPDALNALFSGPRPGGRTEFRYAGCLVTVRADRTVEVATDD